jgi:glycosyltransferase involved in cell wall biosynthesis
MRVQVVDPPAFTPPYDRSLCAALARAGADVELITSRFAHGPVPAPLGYEVREHFYRRSGRRDTNAPARRGLKLAEHVTDMLRYRRDSAAADVRHFQWLPVPALDSRLLPPGHPRLLTAHGVLRSEGWDRRLGSLRRLLDRMDAVIALSEFGRRRLAAAGLPEDRIRVIPHGAFDYLTRQPDEARLPPELAAVTGPVILFFGLIRPYKGVDVLLDAFRSVSDAELWVVGRPLGVSLDDLRQAAERAPGRVRFVPRFVGDVELPAYFRRADVVALPHRDAEQSGVLFAALAFGKAIVMSDVGGFGEVAAGGAGTLVPPGDAQALAARLQELVDDEAERERLARAAAEAATGPYSWELVARQTMDLYRELGAAQ